MCGMMRWDGQPSNRTFLLLSKSATFCKCQMKQMPRRFFNSCSFGELEETTRTPSYYLDEDYPARPEIQQPLPEWSNWCGSESSTLETDVYVWRYACQQWTSSISVRCKWVSELFQYSSEFYKHWLETETWVTSAPVNTDVMGLAALEPATLLTSCDTLDAGATDLTLSGALSTVHTAPDKTHTQVTCVHINEGYEYLLDFIYMSDRWDIPVHLRGLVEEWSITCVHGRE